jgi:hypothetical protein
LIACRCVNARVAKTPAAQALPATLAIAVIAFLYAVRIVARTVCRVADELAPRAVASDRQHFLKLDAVFFNVLVYSGCSAFRFPSARSD